MQHDHIQLTIHSQHSVIHPIIHWFICTITHYHTIILPHHVRFLPSITPLHFCLHMSWSGRVVSPSSKSSTGAAMTVSPGVFSTSVCMWVLYKSRSIWARGPCAGQRINRFYKTVGLKLPENVCPVFSSNQMNGSSPAPNKKITWHSILNKLLNLTENRTSQELHQKPLSPVHSAFLSGMWPLSTF